MVANRTCKCLLKQTYTTFWTLQRKQSIFKNYRKYSKHTYRLSASLLSEHCEIVWFLIDINPYIRSLWELEIKIFLGLKVMF